MAERYEGNSTIITSNLDFTEWSDAFPKNYSGRPLLIGFDTVLISWFSTAQLPHVEGPQNGTKTLVENTSKDD